MWWCGDSQVPCQFLPASCFGSPTTPVLRKVVSRTAILREKLQGCIIIRTNVKKLYKHVTSYNTANDFQACFNNDPNFFFSERNRHVLVTTSSHSKRQATRFVSHSSPARWDPEKPGRKSRVQQAGRKPGWIKKGLMDDFCWVTRLPLIKQESGISRIPGDRTSRNEMKINKKKHTFSCVC